MKLLDSDILGILLALMTFIVPAISGNIAVAKDKDGEITASVTDAYQASVSFDIKGVVVCESPNIEDDAKLLKDFYMSL